MAEKKLTEKQTQEIVALLIQGITQQKIADEYKLSTSTVGRVGKNHSSEIEEGKAKIKKEAQEKVDSWMNDHYKDVCEIGDLALERIKEKLNDPDAMAKTSVVQIATTFGILKDKWAKDKDEHTDDSVEDLSALADLIK